ncbi:MAG: histidine--tRNA ligase [Methylococcales bacterium]|jgi:histidyl-tRNA synthetase|nr:histidine--tRNA ligase [Methylococcales bacterium]
MSKQIKVIKGMHDILPEQMQYWHFLESTVRELLSVYCFNEIRFPVIEKSELFCRTIGEVTDIVEKEMYSFEDRGGDKLSLRPEGTAGCVRAGIENGLLYHQIQKLWYMGPMFRRERPQKGRYRQFHQIGVEVYGLEGPDIDAELIVMTYRLWQKLGLSQNIELQINTLGTLEERNQYKEKLVEYFNANYEQLDEDSQRRLLKNPMRILDSKNQNMRNLIDNSPKLLDYLGEASTEHFNGLKKILDQIGIEYQINPQLVRGLDYYSNTVFEWVTHDLGTQGTVCAGGRYNTLVQQLGGKSTPAVGFAMGMERLISLIEDSQLEVQVEFPDIYMLLVGDNANQQGAVVADEIRQKGHAIKVLMNCGGGSFKSQFKKADKCGAQYAIIISDDEIAQQSVSIKPLRGQGDQFSVGRDELIIKLNELFKRKN